MILIININRVTLRYIQQQKEGHELHQYNVAYLGTQDVEALLCEP